MVYNLHTWLANGTSAKQASGIVMRLHFINTGCSAADAAQCSVTYKVDVHMLHELEGGVRACLSNLVCCAGVNG